MAYIREALRNNFTNIVKAPGKTAVVLSSALALAAGGAGYATKANADEIVAAATSSSHPRCARVVGYSEKSCASPGFEEPISIAEIAERPDLYRNRVIIHFDDGVMDSNLVAEDLTEAAGVPALAIASGNNRGEVQLIVDGMTNPRFKFTQRDINRGVVGSFAERLYNHLKATRPRASLDQGMR